jgi:hypothetical protein
MKLPEKTHIAKAIIITMGFLILFASPALGYTLNTIDINMQAQERTSDTNPPFGWSCAAANLQADIAWATGTWRQQDVYWGFMRDRTAQEVGGFNFLLPLTSEHSKYGDKSWMVRKLNISYDFGVDPHAVAWALWYFGAASYHYYIYYDVWNASYHLLWTVEHYQEPAIAAVYDGSHFVSVTGYKANVPATDPDFSTIYQVRYSDPWPTNPRDNWVTYSSWRNMFTKYTDENDPDPSVGWYLSYSHHWRNHWVTIERDDMDSYNPDWAMTIYPGWVPRPIPHDYYTYIPAVFK